VRAAGGARVAAHPYRRQMPWNLAKPEEYEARLARAAANPAYTACAALERFNGRGSAAENEFSARVCDRLDVASTGASDVHAAKDVARCATEFYDRIEDLEDLIAALKSGRFHAVQLS